ncbi:MAG: CDP-alcohol phosphatidyltransferase family protein, partial [Planctomycetota bacterium]
MQRTQSIMPTVATLANLTAGVLAIMLAVEGRADFGALMVFVAMIFDSADGALARAFDACSD